MTYPSQFGARDLAPQRADAGAHPFLALAGGLLMALFAGAGGAVAAGDAGEAPQIASEGTEAPRPVVTEFVREATRDIRAFPGLIAAQTETSLAFQTAGRLASRPVSVGDRVSRGATLATLDQVTLTQDVAAAEAAVRAAQATAELAEQSLARVQALSERGVAAANQLEAAQAQNESSAAQVLAAQADLVKARDAAKFAVLRAPIAGIVTATPVEPGVMISAGSTVMTLAAEAGREAVIDLPSEMLPLLSAGTEFTLQRRAETHNPSPEAVSGHLRLIEPLADAGTRTRRIRVSLDEVADGMRLGSLVMAQVDSAAFAGLTVPRSAILEGRVEVEGVAGPMVWRVRKDKREAEAVAVDLGDTFDMPLTVLDPAAVTGAQGASRQNGMDDRVIVYDGLMEGDEILTRGVHSVRAGMALGARVE
ncbi:efflux RND transporter periplasmic adaptor subunit [Albirhodobacter sp. R86504]|uniref:efflux RND transporter periplasmic adaptor subunit n=1 Tax=Albirhodobacter sp. R86504 TaxID=3093848 RepID=UPI0036711C23